MVLEMMTNSWERGEATDSLCGFIWLYLDEDEVMRLIKFLKTFKHSFVTFFPTKWSRNDMNVNNS